MTPSIINAFIFEDGFNIIMMNYNEQSSVCLCLLMSEAPTFHGYVGEDTSEMMKRWHFIKCLTSLRGIYTSIDCLCLPGVSLYIASWRYLIIGIAIISSFIILKSDFTMLEHEALFRHYHPISHDFGHSIWTARFIDQARVLLLIGGEIEKPRLTL